MRTDYLINTVLVIVGIVAVSLVFGYWSKQRYEAEKNFFVSSCARAFYEDSAEYEFNAMVDEIVVGLAEELPKGFENTITEYYGGDYLASVSGNGVENICNEIFDRYRADLEEQSNEPCDDVRCGL